MIKIVLLESNAFINDVFNESNVKAIKNVLSVQSVFKANVSLAVAVTETVHWTRLVLDNNVQVHVISEVHVALMLNVRLLIMKLFVLVPLEVLEIRK